MPVAVFAALVCSAQTRFPLETLTAEGVAIPQEILSDLTGLKAGSMVDEGAFRSAAQKLQETGLFSQVAFRYTPGPKKIGYALILTLEMPQETMFSIVDFPGQPDEALWNCMAKRFPWLHNPLPSSGTAQAFLAQQFEKCSQHPGAVIAEQEIDFATSRSQIVFHPRDLPHVAGLSFTGVQKLTAKAVEQALATTAIGAEFTERRFRNLLELNVRPLYESHGMLNVRFTSIGAQGAGPQVAVATAIDEGVVYKLAEVIIQGPDLPVDVAQGQSKFKRGQTAEWPGILKSIEDLEKPLKQTGYIAVRSTTSRKLDDTSASLALTVGVQKGRQYFFDSLRFQGATPEIEQRLRKIWKLAPDTPMDEPYMLEYWKSIVQLPELKDLKVSTSMQPIGQNRVAVVVKIA